MPRPIIGAPRIDNADSHLVKSNRAQPAGLTGPRLEQRLRQRRSRSYVEAIARIDVGAHQSDRIAFDSLLQEISNEFPDLIIDQVPLGIVSKCHLGAPFEVHVCDFRGEILEHFQTYRSMPTVFERARSLAIHPAYALIEVYTNTVRAVAVDGSVSVVGNEGD